MIALRLFNPEYVSEPTEQELSLREYYEKCILPEIEHEQSASSLQQDRVALNHWERLTGDLSISKINREQVVAYRDGLVARGLAPATVNKCWRELRSILLRELVQVAPVDGLILDPFAGSGTTGVAAILEGRRAVLIDQSEECCEVAAKRLEAAAVGELLEYSKAA